MSQNVFQFHNKFFKQTEGTAQSTTTFFKIGLKLTLKIITIFG